MKNIKHILIAGFLGCAMCATTACQENEDGDNSAALARYQKKPAVTLNYNHPCALYSAADFARVKAAIAAGTLTADRGTRTQGSMAASWG